MQKEIDSAIVIYPQVLEKAFNEISDITEIKKKEMFQTIIINDKKWFDLVKEIMRLDCPLVEYKSVRFPLPCFFATKFASFLGLSSW